MLREAGGPRVVFNFGDVRRVRCHGVEEVAENSLVNMKREGHEFHSCRVRLISSGMFVCRLQPGQAKRAWPNYSCPDRSHRSSLRRAYILDEVNSARVELVPFPVSPRKMISSAAS